MKPTKNILGTKSILASVVLLLLGVIVIIGGTTVIASPPTGNPATYTYDADFDEGTLINVNHNSPNNDQLQLNEAGEPFDFIWVAASARGTIIKIDTLTGEILGEYLSAPDGRGRNPSRTTVDANGNVWAGNRAESSGGKGSVVHVGLLENCQCVDRNGNGVIDTSTGLGDIKPWSNAGGVDDNGGVSTAEDECIIHYTRVTGAGTRTVAVDGNNDVWVGGTGDRDHEKIDGVTGQPVVGTQFNVGCGGYGGLVDANGVLWSARNLLRYDPATSSSMCINSVSNSYGLGVDSQGNIWNSRWTNNTITKLAPDGTIIATYSTGGSSSRGVAVTADDHIWVANSGSHTVTRLNNTGVLQATIPVGNQPTGVAVDAKGKVWVTNLGSNTVMRIEPATNSVDLTVDIGAGAGPYNYSDMTGSTLIAPPDNGTWTIVHDTDMINARWGTVSWTEFVPSDSSLTVTAASSSDGVTFGTPETVTNGVDLTIDNGQYLKVIVNFVRATTEESPVLYDLEISANEPPDCSEAVPSIDTIWPPNHKFVPVNILGVTDPDGDDVTITIDSIFQDEPVDTVGDGNFTPDGQGTGTDTAEVRAERIGTKQVPGNGRVYHIMFTADDGNGGLCSGEVFVGVPHDQGGGVVPVDEGALYDSTLP